MKPYAVIQVLKATSIAALLLFISELAYAQHSDAEARRLYAQAEEAFENGNLQEAGALAAQVERQLGAPNPMTTALKVRIHFGRKQHSEAQQALQEYFSFEAAHPLLTEDMLTYARELSDIQSQEFIDGIRSDINENQQVKRVYDIFEKEQSFATSLSGDYAFTNGEQYYFFRPSDKRYLKIDAGEMTEDDKSVSGHLNAVNLVWYSTDVKETNDHYLMAKLRKSNFFSPAYDNGYIGSKPNRFFKNENNAASIYGFETYSDFLFNADIDDEEIKELEGEWLNEDIKDTPFEDYPLYVVETGTFEVTADVEAIQKLARGDLSAPQEGFYRMTMTPSRSITIYPNSKVRVKYDGRVKAYMASRLQNKGFKVRKHNDAGMGISGKFRVHRFKKTHRKTGWLVRITESEGVGQELLPADLTVDRSCWEVSSLTQPSPSKNTGCLPKNYAEFSEEPDLIGFFDAMSQLETDINHELYGDQLTISKSVF